MWNDNSKFLAVHLRDRHVRIHRVPIDLDCVSTQRLHWYWNLNVWTVILDWDWQQMGNHSLSSRRPMDVLSTPRRWGMVRRPAVWECRYSGRDGSAPNHGSPSRSSMASLAVLNAVATMTRLLIDQLLIYLYLENWKREENILVSGFLSLICIIKCLRHRNSIENAINLNSVQFRVWRNRSFWTERCCCRCRFQEWIAERSLLLRLAMQQDVWPFKDSPSVGCQNECSRVHERKVQ